VVANILVGPLMKLAPILSLACKVGGRLCLSGLRVDNLEAIETEYAKYGIDFDQRSTRVHETWRPGAEGEGEWAQISGYTPTHTHTPHTRTHTIYRCVMYVCTHMYIRVKS
jgi:hypothetical protein